MAINSVKYEVLSLRISLCISGCNTGPVWALCGHCLNVTLTQYNSLSHTLGWSSAKQALCMCPSQISPPPPDSW